MKLNAKTKRALAAAKAQMQTTKQNAKRVSQTERAEKKVLSAQWKALRGSAQNLLGHGGIYNVRKEHVTENLVSEGRVRGTLKVLVALIQTQLGWCFVQGKANAQRQFQLGNVILDIGKVKSAHVKFFGALNSAINYVKKNGDSAKSVSTHYANVTHVIGAGSHYRVCVTTRNGLCRDEYDTNENGARFTEREAKRVK